MCKKIKRGMILILACVMLFGVAIACGNKEESKKPEDDGSIAVLQPDTNTDPQSSTTVQQPDVIPDFGTKERSMQHNTIAVGGSNVFAVRNDGTVAFCKSEYSVFDTSIVASWTDVVSIDTDGNDLAALRADGTVVCTNSDLDVSEWTDIVAIEFVSQTILFGLKKDGTVVCSDPTIDVSEWTDIVAMDKNVAVKRDGTVFAANYQYGNDRMTEWTDIVAVSVTGSYHTTVGLKKDGTCVSCGFTVGNERDVDDWTDIVAISAGENHTVGLRRDGTVVACGTGSCCNVGGWTEIVAISAGDQCTLGLRRDGSVVFCGNNASDWKETTAWKDIQVGDVLTDTNPYTVPTLDRTLDFDTGRRTFVMSYDGLICIRPDGTLYYDDSEEAWLGEYINEWTDLIAIDYTNNLLIGVKNDGTVVSYDNAYGAKDRYHSEVSDWTDIVAVSSSSRNGVIGLKKDGTVVSTGYLGKKPDRYVGVSPDAYYWDDGELADWKDLVMVAAGANHAVGLKSDGTCVACNSNEYGQCNVSGWTDIVAICANDTSTFGIKRDGTVVACGEVADWQNGVTGWTDIVALRFGYDHIVGLRKDGTVVACGNDEDPWNDKGQWDVADWTNIVAIDVCNYEDYTVGLRTDGVFVVAGYDAPNINGMDKAQGILMP